MKDRGIRRHHIERLKRKRSHYHGHYQGMTDPKSIGFVCTTPAPCSCLLCGNRRRYEGETRQEKFARLEMMAQIENVVQYQ